MALTSAHGSVRKSRYSGHVDGPELEAWLRERLPIRQGLFLVHGEEQALEGLKSAPAP